MYEHCLHFTCVCTYHHFCCLCMCVYSIFPLPINLPSPCISCIFVLSLTLQQKLSKQIIDLSLSHRGKWLWFPFIFTYDFLYTNTHIHTHKMDSLAFVWFTENFASFIIQFDHSEHRHIVAGLSINFDIKKIQ